MVDAIAPRPPPGLLRAYRIALATHILIIVAIDAGAYTGLLPHEIQGLPGFDKLMHFLLVGTFGALLDASLGHRPIVRVPWVPRVGPGIALALAGTEEFMQRFSPRRSSSWGDLIANYTGILVLSWVVKRITMARLAKLEAAGNPADLSENLVEGAAVAKVTDATRAKAAGPVKASKASGGAA
ncbi:MAG: hypothetical protein U0441_19895 [Polyangiaceae bacterium]